jgi:hypothetical protein
MNQIKQLLQEFTNQNVIDPASCQTLGKKLALEIFLLPIKEQKTAWSNVRTHFLENMPEDKFYKIAQEVAQGATKNGYTIEQREALLIGITNFRHTDKMRDNMEVVRKSTSETLTSIYTRSEEVKLENDKKLQQLGKEVAATIFPLSFDEQIKAWKEVKESLTVYMGSNEVTHACKKIVEGASQNDYTVEQREALLEGISGLKDNALNKVKELRANDNVVKSGIQINK